MRNLAPAIALLFLLASCGGPATPQRPVASPQAPAAKGPSSITEAVAMRSDPAAYGKGLAWLAAHGDAATKRKARALIALNDADTGAPLAAIAKLESAAAESPNLAPYLLVRAMLLRETAGDVPGARALSERIASEFADSAAADEARLAPPRLALREGDSSGASAALDDALRVPIDDQTEPRFGALADSLESLGRPDLAARVRLEILQRYPQGRTIERVYAKLRKPAKGDSPFDTMTAVELASLAERCGRFNRMDQALDLMSLARQRDASIGGRDDFVVSRAKMLFRARHYDDVVAMSLPRDSSLYPELELMRARALWRLDRDAELVEVADRVLRDRPAPDIARDARILLAKYYAVSERDYAKAAEALEAVVETGGTGAEGEVLWDLAWYRILAGDNAGALATLDAYLARFPDSDYTSNALFWKGKLLDASGDLAGRDAAFAALARIRPYDYFTYRARAIAGLPPHPENRIQDAAPSFPDLASLGMLDSIHLRRAEELEELGLTDLSVLEWKILESERPGDPAIAFGLADMLARSGETTRAIQILLRDFKEVVRHGASNVPDRFWQILYPRAHWNLISSEAAARKVDRWLVAGIIRQESAFEASTVSGPGAAGLMQIMPNDATKIAADAGLGRTVTRDDLFDPKTNIALGTFELSQKLERMGGNEILGVAAYNAGENAVREWTAATPLGDVDRFIESIPYAETRLYVKIVMRNRSEYLRVYGE